MMKTASLLLFVFTVCQADTIPLDSGISANQWNSVTGTNVIIQPHPVWAVSPDAKWISYVDSGVGGVVVPNADSDAPTASFYQDFFMTDGNNRAVGDVTVWADDTASVFLDGVPLILRSELMGMYCADGAIGCTQSHGVALHFDFLTDPGSKHTLQFDVYQKWGDVFGLLYDGSIELSDPPIDPPVTPNPEPGSLGVLAGILLAGTVFVRKRQARGVTPGDQLAPDAEP